jgi:hypothetical protein
MKKTLRVVPFSYRFAEQVLNSKLSLKQEIEKILTDSNILLESLSRQKFNQILKDKFVQAGWESQPQVFHRKDDPGAKLDFLKERVGMEVGFTHSSFIGIDLLKFQVCSYSGFDNIDVGVYVVTTSNFQKKMIEDYKQKWRGSLTFEKVVKYLPHFKSAIQVPIYVLGIDII